MKNTLLNKLRLIYVPFLLIALSLIVGYTFLDWLLFIKFAIPVKEIIVQFAIPIVLGLTAVFIWLRPGINQLQDNTNRQNLHFLFGFIAAIAIIIPAVIAQTYIERASGTLSQLESPDDLQNQNSSKYYMLKNYYIDKRHIGVAQDFQVSGKYGEYFNMTIYVVMPILSSANDTLQSSCYAWLGIKFNNSIRNNLSNEDKEIEYQRFAKESQSEFEHINYRQFVYLNREGNTDENDKYREAIKKDFKYNSLNSNVFTAVNEPFEDHNGSALQSVFISLGIGSFVWFVMLFFADLKEQNATQIKREKRKEGKEIKDMLSILIPKPGFYITPLLIDLNILVFLIMVISGLGFISFKAQDLLPWGADYGPLTWGGQWWRLLSSIFIHGGFLHLFANMFGLLFVGILLEPRIGKIKYLMAYLVTGIVSSITSLYWHSATISVGASGAIFGLYGVFLALLLTKAYPKGMTTAFITGTLVFIGYNLFMGFAGAGIDNAAHIGGLISGFIIGFILYPQVKQQSEEEKMMEEVKPNASGLRQIEQ